MARASFATSIHQAGGKGIATSYFDATSIPQRAMTQLSGPEFLDFCRDSNFDDNVNNQISACISSFVDQLPPDQPHTPPLLKQSTQILDELSVLKSLCVEIQTRKQSNSLLSALQAMEKLKVANQDFNKKHPGALLCNDIQTYIDTNRQEILDRTTQLWNQEISIQLQKEGPPSVRVEPTFHDNWALYDACEPQLRLEATFITQFRDLIQYLIRLEVTDTIDAETTITMTLGTTKSVEMLVDNVQNFFLAFSSLCPPQLYSTIASACGHSFVKDLATKSLPQLSPTDSKELPGYKSEIQGIKGLQELLASVGWSNAHILSDYADKFQSIWTAQREAVYLDQMRTSLSGKYQADSWDWDGEDWDDQDETEAPTEEPKNDDTEPPEVIISNFVTCTQGGNIDNFLALFRALAPRYYGDHLIELYAATRELHAHVYSLPHSDEAYARLEAFGAQQLDSALDLMAQSVEKVSSQPPSTKSAQKVVAAVQDCAQRCSAAGPEVRESLLSSIVEQVAVDCINDTLLLADIPEEQSKQIAAYIKGLSGLGAFFTDINEVVPSWIKLQRLQQVLEQNLAGIRGMYDNSMLADFTGRELVKLVEALFVDSDIREDVIRLVR